jgi:hypothetical protein
MNAIPLKPSTQQLQEQTEHRDSQANSKGEITPNNSIISKCTSYANIQRQMIISDTTFLLFSAEILKIIFSK